MKYLRSILLVCPVNEPNGEGNGWHDCREREATGWSVFDDESLLAHFDDKNSAYRWVNENCEDD